MDNAEIADRLDSLAVVLELSEASPYAARAYRRAAGTVRAAAVSVADLVRGGRARSLRGIGLGIETRLVELVQTGAIAELAELERELSPELVGLGRYLGLGAKRSIELARALGVRGADEFRDAVRAGRLRAVPGIGPQTEARLREALAGENDARPRRGLVLSRALELTGPSRPPSGARSPATRGAGGTLVSGWRSSAPPRTRHRRRRALARSRRSWRCWNAARGGRSG